MGFTLDELLTIELAYQEAQWEAYEAVKREFPKYIELGWVKEPAPRRTKEQIRLEIQARSANTNRFEADNRSTLSYRRRKR